MTITETIEIDESNFLEVEFEAEIEWENDGIGAYEFWGECGVDYGHNYQVLTDYPTWNHNLYSFEENWLIAIHLIANLKSIEKSFFDLETSFADDFD